LLKALISDKFSDIWRLLSETTQFLSRTPIFDQHEAQLRSWRQELQSAGKKNTEITRRIRSEITELRKSLRLAGYDLSLAAEELVVDRFRNDAAISEGFKRAVVYFCEDDAYFITGDENHIALAGILDRKLDSLPRRIQVFSKHYLWYKRKGNALILSGSDTESKPDFERLKAMAEANSLSILSKLKSLR
jgi:hypothetical protein